MIKSLAIQVYGSDQLCPSCVHYPSSKETYEWLEAAIARKFPDQPFTMQYIDIHNPPTEEDKKTFAERVIEEDLFYPVVLIEDIIVGEGNPRLKTIFTEMEKFGYRSES